jgi:hypothetical protein
MWLVGNVIINTQYESYTYEYYKPTGQLVCYKNAYFGVDAVVSNGIQVELCRTETKEI